MEVGSVNNLARAVRSYAGQAVASGARIIQDSIGARNYKSLTQTIKKLEEAAVTCRGLERVQLLRTWLSVLFEIQKSSGSLGKQKHNNLEQDIASNEPTDSPGRPSLVLFYDPDSEVEPMNFRDVFLYSQALEGIILSMILEAPNQEEVSLLLDMFGLCLMGGKEIHNAVVNNILDLAKVFSSYEDEVLAKREELLQFAQGAIAGLKINADLGRIDAEASTLKQKLERISASWDSSRENNGEAPEKITLSLEAQEEALAHIRVCSRLEGLLLKKKMLSSGDSPNLHDQKVDKLKVLSESLISSTTKAEKRISDSRVQKVEALRFRAAKSNEVIELEKELTAEIAGLEKQRDELEAELKKVTISLAAARAHLHKTEEERHQFDEASNQLVVQLKTKEDELSRSMAACSVEADVVKTWIQFLEDTWVIQCSFSNMKENQVNDELERHEDYYMNLVISLLSAYKEELMPLINYVGKFVKKFNTFFLGSEASPNDSEASKAMTHRIFFEEYLAYQAKITTTFSVVDNMRGMFYAQRGKINREDDSRVKELFDDIEKLRTEFEAFERPTLETETRTAKVDVTPSEMPRESSNSPSMKASEMVKVEKSEQPSPIEAEQMHDQPEPEREL